MGIARDASTWLNHFYYDLYKVFVRNAQCEYWLRDRHLPLSVHRTLNACAFWHLFKCVDGATIAVAIIIITKREFVNFASFVVVFASWNNLQPKRTHGLLAITINKIKAKMSFHSSSACVCASRAFSTLWQWIVHYLYDSLGHLGQKITKNNQFIRNCDSKLHITSA